MQSVAPMAFDALNLVKSDRNHRAEIDRLLSLEKGNPVDLGIRLIGVPIGSVLYYLYADDPASFLWSGVYVLNYILYRFYLCSRSEHVTHFQQIVAHLLNIIVTISYLWFPSLMLIDLDRNVSIVGAALMGAQLMYLVHRGDTELFLIFGATLAFFINMIVLLILLLPQITSPIGIIGIILSWTALVFYMGLTMLSARARILAENAAKLQSCQAQKMAALGQLAGGIAHDFNNLLTAISGNLELYKIVSDDSEKEQMINAAQQSSARAAKIVNQILIYARKSPLELQVVDANAPLRALCILIKHLVPSNIHLVGTSMLAAKSVKIDSDHLVTALMNLVLNSIDAIEAAGRIDLIVKSIDLHGETKVVGDRNLRPGPYIVYEVTDSGCGIPEDILKSVVDPFFTTKARGKGTGLGLSMVVSIAESTGGGMQIASSPSGTVVKMYVPELTE